MKKKIKRRKLSRFILSSALSLALGLTCLAASSFNAQAAASSGYTTDENELVEYKKLDRSSATNMYYDIKGFVGGSWRSSTYSDRGYKPYLLGTDLTDMMISCYPTFVGNGKGIDLAYVVRNVGEEEKTISFNIWADTCVAGDDSSLNEVNEDHSILIMSDVHYNTGSAFFALSTADSGAQFKRAYYNTTKNYESINPVDYVEEPDRGDSAMFAYWPQATIPSGESMVYHFIVGMGESEDIDAIIASIQNVHFHSGRKIEGKAKTCTEDGWETYYQCSTAECGKYFSDFSFMVEIEDLEAWKIGDGKIPMSHEISRLSGKNATCLQDGWNVYYQCSVCQKLFADSSCTKEITDLEAWKVGDGKINALGHYGSKVTGKNATCLEDGWKDYYRCTRCGKYFEEQSCENEITDLAAWKLDEGKLTAIGHNGVLVEGQPATCTEDGWIDYYQCSNCNKYYKEIECENEIADLAAWKLDEGKIECGHHAEMIEGQEPTCTVAGWRDYYFCSACGCYFEDENCEDSIEDIEEWQMGSGSIDPLGHSWEFSASGSVIKAVCTRNDICELEPLTITVKANSVNYSGKPATISIGTSEEIEAWTNEGLDVPTDITYYQRNKKLSNAPTTWGKYTAKVTYNDVVATVNYIIYMDAPVLNSVASYRTGVKITWTGVKEAAKYRVLRYDQETGKWITIKLLTAGSEQTYTYIDTNVKNNTYYRYAIRCVDSESTTMSAFSNKLTTKYFTTPHIKTAVSGSKGVTLKWDKVDGVKKYAIYRRATGGDWKIHGYATDTTTYVDTTAVNGRTYKYTICCVDENKKQISGIDKINVMTVVVKR